MNFNYLFPKSTLPLLTVIAASLGSCSSKDTSQIEIPTPSVTARNKETEEPRLNPRQLETLSSKTSLDTLLQKDFSSAAETLQKEYSLALLPEDLIYLSRLLYKESGSNGESPEELKVGLEGVMHVIYNRWKFDNQQIGAGIPSNITGNKRFGNGSLMSVIKDNPIEFSAIGASPDYFQKKSFKNKKGEYQLNPYSNPQVQAKLELCYQVVMEVLTGDSIDPTEGALFYHNPNTSTSERLGADKHMTTQVEEEEQEEWRIRSEYRYTVVPTVKLGKHQFYRAESKMYRTSWNNAEGRMEHYIDGKLKRSCEKGRCVVYRN